MSEDNIILHESDENNSEQEAEEYWPEMSDADFISAAYWAMAALDSYDPMFNVDRERIKRIQRRCLMMIDICTKNLYDLLTEEPED